MATRQIIPKRARREWPLGTAVVVTITITFGLVLAVTILCLLSYLTFNTWAPWRIAAETTSILDLAKISLGVVGGIGAAQALVVAYRRQRLLESDESGFVKRFGEAAQQLSGDRPALRLAGVYAMAALADDWAPQRQQCINVLCAFDFRIHRLTQGKTRSGSPSSTLSVTATRRPTFGAGIPITSTLRVW